MKTRPYAVDKHPRREEIQQKLAEGVPIRSLSEKYGIHRTSLKRYKKNRLPVELKKAVNQKDITDAQKLMEIMLKAVQNMERLADSCDEYLRDPDNPELYYVGPRATEIDVVWLKITEYKQSGEPVYEKHKDSLQKLIDIAISDRGRVVSLKDTQTDPRLLLIKSSETLTKQMDTLAQAWKAVDQGRSSFLGTPAWQKVVKTILEATEKHPEMRREIADALSKIEEDDEL